MIKWAVNYLKNTFHPLNVPENIELEEIQLVIARTDKGEEVLKVFRVNSEVAKRFEKSKKTPETF